MKITIVSFQKNRNAGLEAVETEYLKRLSRYAEMELQAIRKWDNSTGLPDRLLQGSRRIGLFAAGKMFSSEGLADRLQQLMNQGYSHLALVIGAAEGIPPQVAAQMEEHWSLSRLTFGHQLVRLILLETLYRSFDLLHGGRYHK
jgi:23S rRNA (pseudouridine1915-N3)-methyltransferase